MQERHMSRFSVYQRAVLAGAGLLSTVCLFFPTTAHAQSQAQASLTVNATVEASCSASAAAMDFGKLDVLNAGANPIEGNLSVTCTNGTAWTASADKGAGEGATIATRVLTGAAAGSLLSYNLYTDAQRNTIWGDGQNNTGTLSGIGSGTATDTTIYAKATPAASMKPDTYQDTVGITINY
jgi:spore coat protein U-like protein